MDKAILTRYRTDCKVLTTLKADLSSIPHSEFEIVSGDKGDYYKISYSIEMSFEAAIGFRLVFKGSLVLVRAREYTQTHAGIERDTNSFIKIIGKVIKEMEIDYGKR